MQAEWLIMMALNKFVVVCNILCLAIHVANITGQ